MFFFILFSFFYGLFLKTSQILHTPLIVIGKTRGPWRKSIDQDGLQYLLLLPVYGMPVSLAMSSFSYMHMSRQHKTNNSGWTLWNSSFITVLSFINIIFFPDTMTENTNLLNIAHFSSGQTPQKICKLPAIWKLLISWSNDYLVHQLDKTKSKM